jgi:hypothetical protein
LEYSIKSCTFAAQRSNKRITTNNIPWKAKRVMSWSGEEDLMLKIEPDGINRTQTTNGGIRWTARIFYILLAMSLV